VCLTSKTIPRVFIDFTVDFEILGIINWPDFEITVDLKDYNVLLGVNGVLTELCYYCHTSCFSKNLSCCVLDQLEFVY